MEAPDPSSTYEQDKAAIDASPPGSMVISADASSGIVPSAFRETVSQWLERLQSEEALVIVPLRAMLVTADLGKAVSRWQRTLGQPEAGVSRQPEGTAVAKMMSWGRDKESARAIIILTDHVARALVVQIPIAACALVHEVAHVHDDFSRGLVMGFPESQTPPSVTDWPRVCAYLAELTWSEYSAESVAAKFLTQEDLLELLVSDPGHLAGVDERLRRAVWSYKYGQRTLASLWNGSVTQMGDVFANLGRAIARLRYADNYEEALRHLAHPSRGAAHWRPVVERLVQELKGLESAGYSKWGSAPFSGIQKVIAEGFHTVGLLPTYDGSNLHVRVP